MIVGKVARVVVGVSMIMIGGLVIVFVMMMAVRSPPVAVNVLVRMTVVLRLGGACRAFPEQDFGLTASTYAAHPANSVS